MKKLVQLAALFIPLILFLSCEKETRNIAQAPTTSTTTTPSEVVINPIDINQKGFDFMEKIQGQWVGINRVIADDYDWFAFDYRAISPSHVHGIFEGGTMGNLMTSFFVTDFKDTRTIMARNGGLLNGIYRISYFVLDSTNTDNTGSYYRFVDAYGGRGIMSFELKFNNDSLYFNAYTSRLGNTVPPKRHMTFKGVKNLMHLAQTAAASVGYPQNTPAWDFSEGLKEEDLYLEQGASKPKTGSFISQASGVNDVFSLGQIALDPFRIEDHPYLGYLNVVLNKNNSIQDKPTFIYLSTLPLTDSQGYLKWNDTEAFNSVLKFPEVISDANEFLFTYLHPGNYYVNVIADANQDGFISPGDITSISQPVTISPEAQEQITISNITIQN